MRGAGKIILAADRVENLCCTLVVIHLPHPFANRTVSEKLHETVWYRFHIVLSLYHAKGVLSIDIQSQSEVRI
jgi:hypothetical protein